MIICNYSIYIHSSLLLMDSLSPRRTGLVGLPVQPQAPGEASAVKRLAAAVFTKAELNEQKLKQHRESKLGEWTTSAETSYPPFIIPWGLPLSPAKNATDQKVTKTP